MGRNWELLDEATPSIQPSPSPQSSFQSLPSRHPVLPSSRPPVIPSSRHPVIPSSRHPVIPSSHHPIIPSSHHPIISPENVLPIHLTLRLMHFAGHAPGRRKGATGEVRASAHGGDSLGRLVVCRGGDADHVGVAVVTTLRGGIPGAAGA